MSPIRTHATSISGVQSLRKGRESGLTKAGRRQYPPCRSNRDLKYLNQYKRKDFFIDSFEGDMYLRSWSRVVPSPSHSQKFPIPLSGSALMHSQLQKFESFSRVSRLVVARSYLTDDRTDKGKSKGESEEPHVCKVKFFLWKPMQRHWWRLLM